MPFPIDIKYIEETEKELGITFPEKFKSKMMKMNGGEVSTREFVWELIPFFDKSSSKRISRTCNHIAMETENMKQWRGFPKNGVAIALMVVVIVYYYFPKVRIPIN